jgi:hypothetical protein
MIKKPTARDIEEFEAMLNDDAGKNKGTSPLPSDNASPLDDLNESEWRWIDAVYLAEKRDPTQLIALLGKQRVPPRVMPYVRGLLEMRLGGKPGERIKLPTQRAITYHLAVEQVRELEAKGLPKQKAVEKAAPKWGLTPKALSDFISGRSGYSRKRRA